MASTRLAASGDGGHDRQRVAVLQRGLAPVHEPDVFFVDVDVDEAAKLTGLVHQPLSEAGELPLEVGHDVVHRPALGLHLRVAFGHLAERGGNPYGHRHRDLLVYELVWFFRSASARSNAESAGVILTCASRRS